MNNLSVVLATRNEEENVGRCLGSVKGIADEIIVVDEYSTDKTREIAKSLGAKVFLEPHHDIFHITKQRALEKATCDWVLQLDADEVVTQKLAKEIKLVISDQSLVIRPEKQKLFLRHQKLIEKRDGGIGRSTGETIGYFIPRRNMFLGKPLIYAGVYPDGVIRLVKKEKASWPQKSVHEQINLDGEVSWLSSDLLHYDSPTFERYLSRLNRYTDLKKEEFEQEKLSKNVSVLFFYSFAKPTLVFLNLYVRHKGFLDGMRGFIWSLFSALHFPIAYFKYWTEGRKDR
ncbi:MAG: glycosyltransferase family 2 protein [Patescibacteria group bacterium]